MWYKRTQDFGSWVFVSLAIGFHSLWSQPYDSLVLSKLSLTSFTAARHWWNLWILASSVKSGLYVKFLCSLRHCLKIKNWGVFWDTSSKELWQCQFCSSYWAITRHGSFHWGKLHLAMSPGNCVPFAKSKLFCAGKCCWYLLPIRQSNMSCLENEIGLNRLLLTTIIWESLNLEVNTSITASATLGVRDYYLYQ